MRFDIENQLSAAQAFTGSATVSTNSYEKQSAAQDIANGRRMALMCAVTVAAGSGSTHTMDLIQADNAALTSNKEVLVSKSILAAVLVVGYVFEIGLPPLANDKQYIGFQNTSSGGTTTVTLDVYLVPEDEIPYFKTFPKVVDAEV